MRLIDADLLKATVPEVEPDSYEDCENCDMMGDIAVRELIDAAPTVDAVPVVRCRDCKFYQPEYWDGVQVGFPCKCDGGMTDPVPESYCSLGERRDADGQE